MERKFDVVKYVESVGRKLVAEYEDARELGVDSNAKGFSIESATRKQVESLLPSILSVGQGYIIDSYGNSSRQIDLVLFERNLCPVFSINESPESTYYPCEGVVAAIEIKSQMGKKEFFDSCEKANSVRGLRRRFNTKLTDKIKWPRIPVREYGSIGTGLVQDTRDFREFPFAEILTGIIAGETSVGRDSVKRYYEEAQRNAHDLLISLDGYYAAFVNESREIANARLGKQLIVEDHQNSFSMLIPVLYHWIFEARTAPFHSFFNYFNNHDNADGQ